LVIKTEPSLAYLEILAGGGWLAGEGLETRGEVEVAFIEWLWFGLVAAPRTSLERLQSNQRPLCHAPVRRE
jgi:hypothetical protein